MLCALFALSACGVPKDYEPEPGNIVDPFEGVNRGMHAFNKGADLVLLRPLSIGYTTIMPDPIEDSLNLFSENLSEPGNAVNYLLQGDLPRMGKSLGRFVMNSTIGFAGLADPASEFGLPPEETDFGKTLHSWGVGEGAYIELPLFGPSTQRDAIGRLLDFFTNPITLAFQRPSENIGFYAGLVERFSDRGRFAGTIDSILYESADSYAQSRVIFLQNRRFDLAEDGSEAYPDPYDDPFSDTEIDPYAE